jgi:hypothetical protein
MALRLMEDELHFNQEAVCQVCHEDRRKKKISMKYTPSYIVSWVSKRSIVTVCEDFIQTKFLYYSETQYHGVEWRARSAPFTCKIKTVLIIFFTIHLEFVSDGKTENLEFYLQVLKILWK